MDIFNKIIIRIIKEQELIIGPLAWIEADKVEGLTIHEQGVITLDETKKPQDIINDLVAQYERLFGKASHEVCRQAVTALISQLNPTEIPTSIL